MHKSYPVQSQQAPPRAPGLHRKLHEVATSLEHAAQLQENMFELDGDHQSIVVVDRDRVKRALTNILDNALRYSPRGAPVHITWTALDDSSVEITVRDHGPGIDATLLPHVFEPGIRGIATPDDSDGGAGLGLAIAKRLLEHQQATLTAHNQASGGAAISLTLGRAPSAVPDAREQC